jgi:hypothetical protein
MAHVNRPIRFQGTPEEARANYETHAWTSFDGEVECMDCCAKPWHAAASYPCGVGVPREEVEIPDAEAALPPKEFLIYASLVNASKSDRM